MAALPTTLDHAGTALFLDIDGTLLDIRDRPDDVAAEADLVQLLSSLSQLLGGALSLVSGRPISDIDRIFAPEKFPAAGSHGAEIRLHPDEAVRVAHAGLPGPVKSSLQAFAESHHGILLEQKSGGASLHYRMAPELESTCRELVDELMNEVGDEFRMIPGKMVFELAPRGHNKGNAITAMMNRQPFAGRRPVFVGDDVTDEDGFRAVNAMQGIAVRVGEDDNSAAAFTLGNVAAVRHWLEALVN